MRAHTAPREMRLIAGKPESVDGAPWRQRRGIPFREGGMFMKVLELFSGTRSIGEAFEKRGHEVFSVEWDESLPADLHADIEFLKAPDVLRAFGRPDVVLSLIHI